MTSKSLSVRQWQERYQARVFDCKDITVQREAGWWNWHCRNDVLANRLTRIAPVVMGITSPLILDQCSVWFANECTENKLLYDSVRFERLNGSINSLFSWWITRPPASRTSGRCTPNVSATTHRSLAAAMYGI